MPHLVQTALLILIALKLGASWREITTLVGFVVVASFLILFAIKLWKAAP